MRICPKCGTGHQRNHAYCAGCHAANMRRRRRGVALIGLARLKDIARSIANVYKRRGKITPEPCRVCGGPAQMHQPDYSKPLLVEWYCREHHLALHRQT